MSGDKPGGQPLTVRGLYKSFGGIHALRDVSLSLDQNEIVGLIGPNGSGKSTLVNCISGHYKPDRGTVMFYGKDITGFPPHRVLKIGLARTFQAVRIYQELTAFENVEVPFTTLSPPRSQSSSSSSSSSAKDDAENGTRLALQLVGLDSETDRRVGTFSLFQQRMLEIASRIVTKPRVLLLDEPAGGLSEGETDSLIALVRTLQRNGTSILIIEHTLRVISDVASRVVVLDQGQVIADAPCDQVLVDPKVIEAYLGTGRAQ